MDDVSLETGLRFCFFILISVESLFLATRDFYTPNYLSILNLADHKKS